MDNLLRTFKYKNTKTRSAIYKILKENKLPISAEEIFKKIKKSKKSKNTNLATVYRTLSAFETNGLLKTVNLGKDSAYFELTEDHHHHIVCKQCDTIEDFKNKEVENILEKIVANSSKFKKITEHSFEIFGFCKKCA